MIVDLMRNDLGRVAAYGSVARARRARGAAARRRLAPRLRGRARELAAGATATPPLLRATFPPGSVTGAPKVQALHVISELEATGREVYTGAIGFASPHAGLELNVAIRTFEAHGGHLWLGAGGGIVADSDPARRARGVPASRRARWSPRSAAGSSTSGSRPAAFSSARAGALARAPAARPGARGVRDAAGRAAASR